MHLCNGFTCPWRVINGIRSCEATGRSNGVEMVDTITVADGTGGFVARSSDWRDRAGGGRSAEVDDQWDGNAQDEDHHHHQEEDDDETDITDAYDDDDDDAAAAILDTSLSLNHDDDDYATGVTGGVSDEKIDILRGGGGGVDSMRCWYQPVSVPTAVGTDCTTTYDNEERATSDNDSLVPASHADPAPRPPAPSLVPPKPRLLVNVAKQRNEVQYIVETLLYSDERRQIEREKLAVFYAALHDKWRKYIFTMQLKRGAVPSFVHVYIMAMRLYQELEIVPDDLLLYDAARVDCYVQLLLSGWQFVSTYCQPRLTSANLRPVTLALFHLMQPGLCIKGIWVIPRDPYIAQTLPVAGDLARLGFERKHTTCGLKHIGAAFHNAYTGYNIQLTNLILTEMPRIDAAKLRAAVPASSSKSGKKRTSSSMVEAPDGKVSSGASRQATKRLAYGDAESYNADAEGEEALEQFRRTYYTSFKTETKCDKPTVPRRASSSMPPLGKVNSIGRSSSSATLSASTRIRTAPCHLLRPAQLLLPA